ncbi:MAG: (Fe-S)-binding protein, partial [Candidatus Hodarchaeota archaeon]
GCYRTLKLDYTDLLQELGIEVLHSIEFVEKYIDEKNIALKNIGLNVTYHDPCHLGRHANLYEPQRKILRKIANLTEMKATKEHAKCCGAGGGVKKAFPDLALNIAKSRIEEAVETGADYLVSSCPFCYRNLSDAIKTLDSKIIMKDLTQLIDEALE